MPEIDKTETTKSERLLLAQSFVRQAIAKEEHFICVMSTDDGTNCESQIVGHGRAKVFAYCFVEVIKSDERLKNFVLAELAMMCLTEMQEQDKEKEKETK